MTPSGPNSDDGLAFQLPEDVRTRCAELIEREKSSSITPDELTELNHYLETEHLMRLVKARGRGRRPDE